jgi:hypothetical protein
MRQEEISMTYQEMMEMGRAFAESIANRDRAIQKLCAEAICPLCHDGVPLYHDIANGVDAWYHCDDEEEQIPCPAAAIWQLRIWTWTR